MSLNIMQLFGHPPTPSGRSPRHIVNAPITVQFMSSRCQWSVKNNKLVHLPEDDPPKDEIPAEDPEGYELNAWAVREDFLAMKTPADLMKFLSSTGIFFNDHESGKWTLGDLFGCQVALRRLLERKPEQWRKNLFPSWRV